MAEREHEKHDDRHQQHRQSDGDLIPDADAGRTKAAEVSRDQKEEGHEEYKTP